MPTQVESNQQALQNAQLQLQAVQESITRDRDRQVTVQRQLADLAMAASMAPPPDPSSQAKAALARAGLSDVRQLGELATSPRTTGRSTTVRRPKPGSLRA